VWVGSINSDVSVAVSLAETGIKTIEDVFTKELVVGGAGPSDNSVVYANILNNMMGAKLKLVTGYNGSNANVLALERGEVQGIAGWNYSSVTSMRPTWVKEGRIHILLQMALERHADLPDVRTILEIAKNDEQREVLKLIFTQSLIGRVLAAPPKLSQKATESHRKAFDAVIADKEFLADAAKLRLEVNGPLPGARVQEIVGGLYSASPERLKQAAQALGES
jgi:tripartite-type tricarboxylate transporter receptor subunit TctC